MIVYHHYPVGARIIRQGECCYWWTAVCLVLLLIAPDILPSFQVTASSASSGGVSSNNYNVYNYDMTTPQFTPDGRLLQVEYASAAAELSSPLVAFQVNSTLVLVALRTSSTIDGGGADAGSASSKRNLENDATIYPSTTTTTTPQNRMILLEEENIVIAMSGVLADSIALLQVLLKQQAQNFRSYRKPLTLFQVATVLANACQQHSFGGGLRPYGSTMLVCGLVNSGNIMGDDSGVGVGGGNKIQMYQVDPSGSLLKASGPPTTTKDDNDATTTTYFQLRWIVGGNPTVQRQLRKRIEPLLFSIYNNSNNNNKKSKSLQQQEPVSLADTIASVAKAMFQETQKLLPAKGKQEEKKKAQQKQPPLLEVVLISPTLGCHRLTKEQLESIRHKMIM